MARGSNGKHGNPGIRGTVVESGKMSNGLGSNRRKSVKAADFKV